MTAAAKLCEGCGTRCAPLFQPQPRMIFTVTARECACPLCLGRRPEDHGTPDPYGVIAESTPPAHLPIPAPAANPSPQVKNMSISGEEDKKAKAGTQAEHPLSEIAGEVGLALRESQAREIAVLPRFHADALAGILEDQAAVRETLRRKLTVGIHYGMIPGLPGEMLFEAGADTILPAYHCRATPAPGGITWRTEEDSEHLAVTVVADVIRWDTGEIVASGIGGASTRELKYAYRWVLEDDPALRGLDKAGLKTRTLSYGKDAGKTQYRAPNPDLGDLENTIIKMAFKRAKVDAVQALPGVAGLFKQEERK